MKPFSVPAMSYSFIFSLLVHIQPHQAKTQISNQANGSFAALLVFGDSIVDPGNNNNLHTIVKSNFPPYGKDFYGHRPTGRFNNGKIITDFLVSGLGIKDLLPAYLDPSLGFDDLLTGVSFASAGAGFDNLTAQLASVLTLWNQLELFKEYIGKVKATIGEERAREIISQGFYVICAGSDDLTNTYFPTPIRRAHYSVNQYLDLMLQAASSFIKELYRLGARKLAMVGIPPLGCIPSQRTLVGGINRDCVASYNQAASTFNSKLSVELKSLTTKLPGSKIIKIDAYNILLQLIQNPHKYGFEEATKGCCGTGTIEVSVLCNRLTPYMCPDVSKYLFWDSYHPTEKACNIIVTQHLNEWISQLT